MEPTELCNQSVIHFWCAIGVLIFVKIHKKKAEIIANPITSGYTFNQELSLGNLFSVSWRFLCFAKKK